MPLRAGEALGRGDARLGHAHHHVGLDRRLLGELLAHARRGPGGRSGRRAGCRAGRSRRTRTGTAWGRSGSAANGCSDADAGGVDDHHLAGLELADEVGADDVEGRASPRPAPSRSSSRPRHSGRKPLGSRTPMTWPSSMSTNEKAPSSRGSDARTQQPSVEVVRAVGERSGRRASLQRSQLGAMQLGDEVAVARDRAGRACRPRRPAPRC